MAYLHGKFVWFEHVSSDLPGARKFYGALFGWQSDPVPMGEQPYHMIQAAGEGIGGFREAPAGMPNHWISYVSVADVDASAKKAQAAGGKLMMPPTDFAPAGRAAGIADPNGGMFAIWKGAQDDPPDRAKALPGTWAWNECWTSDQAKALAFYENVLGYAHDAMDMGPQGTYYILKKDGVPRAGLATMAPGATPGWLQYVAVENCDGAARKAQGLGAKVPLPPTDVPGVGRFTILVDPTGVPIGALQAAAR